MSLPLSRRIGLLLPAVSRAGTLSSLSLSDCTKVTRRVRSRRGTASRQQNSLTLTPRTALFGNAIAADPDDLPTTLAAPLRTGIGLCIFVQRSFAVRVGGLSHDQECRSSLARRERKRRGAGEGVARGENCEEGQKEILFFFLEEAEPLTGLGLNPDLENLDFLFFDFHLLALLRCCYCCLL